LPSSLKKIDDLDREDHHGIVNWIESDSGGELDPKETEPKWVEELKWDEVFEERHGPVSQVR
jgi:hypothetical protein